VADDIKVEVIERITDGIPYYTVLKDGWVYLITRDKTIVEKFIKKGKKNGKIKE
jgi:hypothetical protein